MGMIINYVICTCISIAGIVFLKELKDNKSESNMPMFATNLGVIGTFLGITVGLAGFDVSNIDASIPILLEGMKTAFYTSLVGMGTSILMKVVIGIKNNTTAKEDNELDYADGIEVTKALLDEMKKLNKTTVEGQNSLKDIFCEMQTMNNEHSKELLQQVTCLRADLIEKNDELIGEFKDIGAKMVEMSSKSIIEALNEVIKDFNTNLTEQFGENFKELNVAVGELVNWQENYKEHIELSSSQLNRVIAVVESIQVSYTEIVERSKEFDRVNEMLGITLGEAAVANEELAMGAKTLVEISKEAVQVIPNLKGGFEAFTNYSMAIVNEGKETSNRYMKESLVTLEKQSHIHNEKIEDVVSKSASVVEEQFKDYIEKFTYLLEALRTAIPEVNDEIVQTSIRFNNALELFEKEIGNAIRANIESVKSQITSIEKVNTTISNSIGESCSMIEHSTQKAATEIESTIKGIVENTNHAINEKITTLEQALENELNVALKSLGTNLVQISRKFTEDYTPLAEKLKEVVNLVKEV